MTNSYHNRVLTLASGFAGESGKQFIQRKAWHDATLAQRTADWYMDALAGDRTPSLGARLVWADLAKHVHQQFTRLSEIFSIVVVEDDPYPGGAEDLFRDLDRGWMFVLSTETTGGHPLWTNQQNDEFRAVHDIFGHYAQRLGFDRAGEDGAFRSHASMLPNSVLPALAVETRAQNSALCYGPEPGTFKDQLCVLPPAWIWNTNNHELEW